MVEPDRLARAVSETGGGEAHPLILVGVEPDWSLVRECPTSLLLVRGEGLTGARVASAPGLRVTGDPRVNAAGTWLLVEVAIDSGAAPGPRRLRVTTAEGSADFPFDVRPPAAREGRREMLLSVSPALTR